MLSTFATVSLCSRHLHSNWYLKVSNVSSLPGNLQNLCALLTEEERARDSERQHIPLKFNSSLINLIELQNVYEMKWVAHFPPSFFPNNESKSEREMAEKMMAHFHTPTRNNHQFIVIRHTHTHITEKTREWKRSSSNNRIEFLTSKVSARTPKYWWNCCCGNNVHWTSVWFECFQSWERLNELPMWSYTSYRFSTNEVSFYVTKYFPRKFT